MVAEGVEAVNPVRTEFRMIEWGAAMANVVGYTVNGFSPATNYVVTRDALLANGFRA